MVVQSQRTAEGLVAVAPNIPLRRRVARLGWLTVGLMAVTLGLLALAAWEAFRAHPSDVVGQAAGRRQRQRTGAVADPVRGRRDGERLRGPRGPCTRPRQCACSPAIGAFLPRCLRRCASSAAPCWRRSGRAPGDWSPSPSRRRASCPTPRRRCEDHSAHRADPGARRERHDRRDARLLVGADAAAGARDRGGGQLHRRHRRHRASARSRRLHDGWQRREEGRRAQSGAGRPVPPTPTATTSR